MDLVHHCWVLEKTNKWSGISIPDMSEPEITQSLSLLDPTVISEELETYLPGQKVAKIHIRSTEDTTLSLRGSFNLLIKIGLEDGQSWFMRIRKRSAGRLYPDEVLRMNLESEVATCQTLFQGGVAAPQTFIRPRDSKHHPKLIYCYQAFIPGGPWQPFDPIIAFNNPPKPHCDDPTLQHITSLAK